MVAQPSGFFNKIFAAVRAFAGSGRPADDLTGAVPPVSARLL